ncbi:gas vesicle protein GvpO [Spirillospora sp. CA-294931]|uniref:gas vesicle protein GvpO n=1 Tax=Spirillospora sp. CA-294931 TaxID=3240042 RepID=UPI003D8C67A1
MLAATDAARAAADHVTALTGRPAESIVGLRRNDTSASNGDSGGEVGDGGGWLVTVEVVEVHRIPDSADILAVYDTEIDGDGELVSCRRARRYARGHVGKE